MIGRLAWRRAGSVAIGVLACLGSATAGEPPFLGSAIPGDPTRPAAREHLDWLTAEGFDAVWLDGDALDLGSRASRRAWRRESRRRGAAGLRIGLTFRPARPGDAVDWTDPSAYESFCRRVRRAVVRSGVRDVVFDAHRREPELRGLRAAARFGRLSVSAEADWVRRLRRDLPAGARLWWWPSLADSASWSDGRGDRLVRELAALPADVGLVWSGPDRVSDEIGPEDLEGLRRIAGTRPWILRDGYPMNLDGRGLALALVLGALRGRAPELRDAGSGYVCWPMRQLGASRAALRSIARWWADPLRYDADREERALASAWSDGDPDVEAALRTQFLEWGGPVGGRNYRPAWDETPERVAARLLDPAFVASFKWVRERYPERAAHIARCVDRVFARDVTEAMARRLAIARAVPEAVALRSAAGPERERILGRLRALRESLDGSPRRAFLRFVDAAGLEL